MINQGSRDIILTTVEDLVAGFLYYDRKEDENLPRGTIEQAVKDGDVSVAEIVDKFRESLNLDEPPKEG